jgi:hypothetical protein
MTADEINKLALVANKIANQIDRREDHARLLDAIATLRDAALRTEQRPAAEAATGEDLAIYQSIADNYTAPTAHQVAQAGEDGSEQCEHGARSKQMCSVCGRHL